MTNIETFPQEHVTTDEHFGGCPTCGKNDGYLNIGKTHWFFCEEHTCRWHAGSNFFSSWHEESEDDWKANELKLAAFAEVNPVWPVPGPEDIYCGQETLLDDLIDIFEQSDAAGAILEKLHTMEKRGWSKFRDGKPLSAADLVGLLKNCSADLKRRHTSFTDDDMPF